MANTTDSPILDKAGRYNLSVLEIISYRQQKDESAPKIMDIRGICEVFELHEDILRSTLYGTVTVYDTQDIRSILPLTGLERLSVKFNTPGMPGYDMTEDNGTPFQIYKVDKVTKVLDKDKAQYYQIHFCSPEFLTGQLESVSRAYAGPIENAVNDIVVKKLKSKKPFFFENTATNAKYVIPSLKPLQAINFLSRQCVSGKYNNAGYMFYETSKGFQFRSIECMLALNGSMARHEKFTYQPLVVAKHDVPRKDVNDLTKNSETQNVMLRMKTVISYDIDKHADTLGNIIGGMYANRLVVHDAFNKTIKTHDFNYIEDFAKGFHTETTGESNDSKKHVLPNAQLNDTGAGLHQYPNSKKMVVTETSKVHNDYEFVPTNETLPKITSQRMGMENLNLTLSVYGNTSLNAGDVIYFNTPLMRPGDKEQENPFISGRYLIMAIKHIATLETGTHEMILRCMKDSVRTPYPSESDPLIVGKDNAETKNIYEEDVGDLTYI